MFIDKDSLKVTADGKTINLGNYIVEARYGFNKMWSEDVGRNLKGSFSGSLLGIFPKIIVQFRKLNRIELETIAPILDSAIQNLTYYDPCKKRNITISTYTGDWENTNTSILANKPFSISFISRSKR